MTQDELNKILDQLTTAGANKDELELWKALYPTLPEERKLAIDKNLLEELKQLRNQN